MILSDQKEVTAFLGARETHGVETPVEIIDTHISRIFLAGPRAYKLKRAVLLPYADFSSPAIRAAGCDKELALNAPTAPDLYLGVRRITRAPSGKLCFDGTGPLVDAVVEMVRFDQEALLDRVAERGGLTAAHIEALARDIAEFHARAPVIRGIGGAEDMAAVLDINARGFATSRVFTRTEARALDESLRRALARHAGWLDRRALAGRLRRCHGDLHLRNICLVEGRPRLFDCIDFNDDLATVDVLYDLAFLLMDLWHRGFKALANLLANRYFDATGEDDGFGLLPFLMAVRAQVRAHVIATASESGGDRDEAQAALARSYFDLAKALVAPGRKSVVALGGFSGSGKTTLAGLLAPALGRPPGARIVESDLTRKALFGLAPEQPLPPDAYADKVSDAVYRRLADRAAALVHGGASALIGAVYDRAERRAALERALSQGGVRHALLWLEVSPEMLRERIAHRGDSASDATLNVLTRQLARDAGEIGWVRIDADGSVDATQAALRAALAAQGAV